ncbi:MAG: hypothetical protein AAF664_06690, partial [Planctomycetota bacterium]
DDRSQSFAEAVDQVRGEEEKGQALREHSERLESQIKELREELANQQSKHEKSLASLADVQQNALSQNTLINQQKHELDSHQGSLAELRQTAGRQEKELADKVHEIDLQSQKYNKLIEQYRSQTDLHREAVEKHEQEMLALGQKHEQFVEALKHEHAETVASLSQTKDQAIADLRQEQEHGMQHLRVDAAEQAKRMKMSFDKELETVQAELQNSRKLLQQQVSERDQQLQRSMQASETMQQEHQGVVVRLNSQINETQKMLDTEQSKIATQQREIQSLQAQLSTLRSAANQKPELEKRIAELTLHLKRVSAEHEDSLEANAESQQRVRALEEELHQKSAKIRDLRRQRAHWDDGESRQAA